MFFVVFVAFTTLKNGMEQGKGLAPFMLNIATMPLHIWCGIMHRHTIGV